MVLVYDRLLLRSSARGDGALKETNDRLAIGLLEPGCAHPGYGALGTTDRYTTRSEVLLPDVALNPTHAAKIVALVVHGCWGGR